MASPPSVELTAAQANAVAQVFKSNPSAALTLEGTNLQGTVAVRLSGRVDAAVFLIGTRGNVARLTPGGNVEPVQTDSIGG